MKVNIFDFINYKDYLRHWIDSRPQKGRGERSRMAEALRCQLAYLSQVFNGPAHLSFEQAEMLNAFLNHTDDEAEFLHLLVHLGRAGTPALKNRIQKKIQATLDHRLVLRNRLQFDKTLSREDQMLYYSAWYYSAVHIALSIPALQNHDALANAFKLPASKISQILEFLTSRGLVHEEKGRYQTGTVRIHLESDSPMISKHHTNWRTQALQALERDNEGDLHYSSVVAVEIADLPRLREALVKAIEQVREIARPSGCETVCCYTLDLFRLT